MGDTARVACYMGIQKPFEIREYAIPDPEPGAILVRVERANICGSDLHFWKGSFDLEDFGMPVPTVLGHEVSGTVARLGKDVSTDAQGVPLRVGDKIVFKYFYPCGRCRDCFRGNSAACLASQGSIMQDPDDFPHFSGGFADYLYLMAGHTVLRAPTHVPSEVLAGLNCAMAQVLYGLQRANVRQGEAIVIQGVGGLGLYATAIAREMGAYPVIAVDAIPARLDLAAKFGAHEIVCVQDFPEAADRISRVQDLTQGWGADVVIELVGSAPAFPEAVGMLAPGGRVIEIGNISAGKTTLFDPSTLTNFSRSAIGVVLYTTDTLRMGLSLLERLHGEYPFEEINSAVWPLAAINEAFAAASAGTVIRASVSPLLG